MPDNDIAIRNGNTLKVTPSSKVLFEVIRDKTQHSNGARAQVIDERSFRLDVEQLDRFINDINMAAGILEGKTEYGDHNCYYLSALELRDQLRDVKRELTNE